MVSSNTRGFPRRKIEMKKLMLVLVASACCSAFTMNASAQQADQATADAVIAMTKAQWAAEIKDPTSISEQMKDASDDYTEFNGDYATRLDGKAMNSPWGRLQGRLLARRSLRTWPIPKSRYTGMSPS